MFSLLRPTLYALSPERAHHTSIAMLDAWGRARTPFAAAVPVYDPVTIAGVRFPNRIGLAAGFDKDARAIAGLFGLGFGAVEVGTLTPRPQPGNPRPRLFRLSRDRAIINRMGFNNGGLDAALPRIATASRHGGVLGINVGANKDSDDRIADYTRGVAGAAQHGDYITINISSPNTPGLRDLQEPAVLCELLYECDRARHIGGTRRPLFLKIAPDLDKGQVAAITTAAIDHGIDALIVSNTTISRPDGLRSPERGEAGGLSGAPLAALARARLADAVAASDGAIPLISVGGIGDADEVLRRIDAGASLVQIYSALIYQGPGLPRRILKTLSAHG